MFDKTRVQRILAGKGPNPAGRRRMSNACGASLGSLPWHAAQFDGAAVKYVLTANGYVVL